MSRPSRHWGERIYGLVVAMYPRTFRERYGPAMRQVFRDQVQDPDLRAWRIWLSVVGDLRGSFFPEHLANLMGGLSMTRYQLPSPALLRRGAAFGCAVILTWIAYRSLHLFGGQEASPQGWVQVRDFLRLLAPWLLFVAAGYVGASYTRSFGGGIWAGFVAGVIAALAVPGDYLLFHHLIPGGVIPTAIVLVACAVVGMTLAAAGAGVATLTHRSGPAPSGVPIPAL